MLASLSGSLSGYQLPHYCPNPISFFDIPEESLDDFMALMVATDLTMQAPSPSSDGSGWIPESPTPTLHDTSVYFPSPLIDAGHLMMTAPKNQLHQTMHSDFADDVRQCNAVNCSDCAPVTSIQFGPPLDVSWPTIPRDLHRRGQVPPMQTTQNQYQRPDRTSLPEFSSQEPSTATDHIKPTCLLPNYNGVDTYFVNRTRDPSYDWQRDPRAMRECLMLRADGKPLTEMFRKSAKDVVASPNTRRASSARRKHAARFKCPIDGCNDDFTRKHNLDNHLRSHCGITDLICDVCHLGFTTIPVWRRHKKNCRLPEPRT